MDFRLTDEQELLTSSLKELLEREAPESLMAELDARKEFPWEPWKALAENGYLGLGVDEKYGGTPANMLTLCLVAEVMGKYAFPLGLNYGLGVITVKDLEHFGNEDQKEEILGGFVKGDAPLALGISEPQAGSDAASLKTSAVLDGDEFVINGQKIYCTLADVSKYILLLARDPQIESLYKTMSTFLLPTDAKGVRINRLSKLGWWSAPTCEVFIDNVRLPKSAVFGQLNNGWMQIMSTLKTERIILSAVCLGAAEAAFEDAAGYANQREQFGQAIGGFQLIQEKITEMAIKIENMKNYCYKLAWMVDQGNPVRYEHAMAKLYITRTAFEVIDDAMQVMGGVGYMMDHRIQRLWRDVRAMRITSGSDQVMVNLAGPQIIQKYRKSGSKK